MKKWCLKNRVKPGNKRAVNYNQKLTTMSSETAEKVIQYYLHACRAHHSALYHQWRQNKLQEQGSKTLTVRGV